MSAAETPTADPKLTHVAKQWQHESPLISCRFEPLGRYLFTTAEDYQIQRWDLQSGAKVAFDGHDSWTRAIAFLPDGEAAITGGYDGRIVWWPTSAERPEPVRHVDAHTGWVNWLSVSPDGKLLASAGNDCLVKIWNAADGSLVRELAGHAKYVYSLLFHPSGELLLSADLGGDVRQWDVASGKLVRQFDAKPLYSYNDGQGVDYGGVRSMALSADGKYLACCGLHKASNPLGAVNEPLVLLLDWETGALVRSHIAEGVVGVAWRVTWHPDGTLIGASGGSGGGFLLFWKPDADKDVFRLQLPNTARDMDLHPDGLQVASVHHDRHVRISRMAAPQV
jgi:WD40 repeat protein